MDNFTKWHLSTFGTLSHWEIVAPPSPELLLRIQIPTKSNLFYDSEFRFFFFFHQMDIFSFFTAGLLNYFSKSALNDQMNNKKNFFDWPRKRFEEIFVVAVGLKLKPKMTTDPVWRSYWEHSPNIRIKASVPWCICIYAYSDICIQLFPKSWIVSEDISIF